MLTHIRDLGFRIGTFAAPRLSPADTNAVASLLADRHGPDSTTIVPSVDEADVRAAVRVASPALADLGDAIREALETSHSGVLIPQAGLDHLDINQRRHGLYGLALCIGQPTATDRVDRRVVWDILARDETLRQGHVPTYSEHAAEAELHTDTQYFAEPERYLMLYFVRPAACGGGASMLRDGACVRARMERTTEGRWAADYLSRHDLPFRIPTTFTRTQDPDAVEVTFAPVFGSRPGIRYRLDTLRRGLAACPDRDTPDLRRALEIFETELLNTDLRVDGRCDADDLLIINNHDVLHGRSAFTDRQRHALRIRMNALPA